MCARPESSVYLNHFTSIELYSTVNLGFCKILIKISTKSSGKVTDEGLHLLGPQAPYKGAHCFEFIYACVCMINDLDIGIWRQQTIFNDRTYTEADSLFYNIIGGPKLYVIKFSLKDMLK